MLKRNRSSFLLAACSGVLLTMVMSCTQSGDENSDTSDQEANSPGSVTYDTPFDPLDPLRSIISIDQMRGLDANLQIVDPDELARSLEDAGLAQPQIDALRSEDLSLDTYVSLANLEVACLRDQGIAATDPEIVAFEYGIQRPTYSYPAEVAGMTEADLAYKQITCQNQYTGAYLTLFVAYNSPSQEEMLEIDISAANAFLACSKELGVETPLDAVSDQSSLDEFYTWYASPEADIACSLRQ